MAIRRKTRRRLLIIGLTVGALALAFTGFYYLRGKSIERKLLASRAEGMAAFEAGDWEPAFKGLGKYLRVHRDDPEAIYRWALARLEVPAARGEHLMLAIGQLQRLLDLDPGHREAAARLLQLYEQINQMDEALILAESMLREDPKDEAALRAKAMALNRQGKRVEAFRIADALNTERPESLKGQLLALEILGSMRGDEVREVIAAERLAEIEAAHPDLRDSELPGFAAVDRFERLRATGAGPYEHRFVLLYAAACLQPKAARLERAREELSALAERALAEDRLVDDEEFVSLLIDILDVAFLHDDAIRVLDRAASSLDDPDLTDRLAQRLWETGRYEDMVDRLAGVAPESVVKRPETVALKALALIRIDRIDEAEPYVAALENQAGAIAGAWARYFREVVLARDPSPFQTVEVCRDIIPVVPRYVHFAWSLAVAYERAGEVGLAANGWSAVISRAPWWPEPRIRQIRAFLKTGQIRAAAGGLQLAIRILPGDGQVDLLKAAMDIANPNTDPERLRSEVVAVLDAQEDTAPEEVAPLRVSLLVRLGREAEAMDALARAVASDPPPSVRGFLDLATVARSSGLGEGLDSLFSRAKDVHGRTPELTYAQAMVFAGDGREIEGTELLRRAREEAGGGEKDPRGWDLVQAAYSDAIGDAESTARWNRLAAAYPGDQRVQRAILGSRAAWRDRGLVDGTIDRLKASGGEEGLGLTWRMARARWLLTAPPGEPVAGVKRAEPAEGLNRAERAAAVRRAERAARVKRAELAVAELGAVVRAVPDLLQPRLLLADAFGRLGESGRAVEQLEKARGLAPGLFAIVLDLSRHLINDGKPDRARRELADGLGRLTASPDQLQLAAALLLRVGDKDQAARAMSLISDEELLEPSVGLARVYAVTGDAARARTICLALLREGSNTGAQELLGAILLDRGDVEEAVKAMEGLPRKEEILALYHRRLGDLETSTEHYRAAVRSEPGKAANWQGLAALLAANGDFAEASGCIVEAGRQGVDLSELPDLEREGRFLDPEKAAGLPPGLIIAWIEEPRNRQVAIAAMDILLRRLPPGSEDVDEIAELAEEHTRFLSLQVVAADVLAAAGRFRESLRVSSRAMAGFPRVAMPARQYARDLRLVGRWPEAVAALEDLRKRLPAGLEQVDVLLFDTLIRAGRAAEVVRLAEERYESLTGSSMPAHADLDKNQTSLLVLIARAHVIDDGGGEGARVARRLLEGGLDLGPAWRAAWVDIASTHLRDAADAIEWLDRVAKNPSFAIGEWMYLGNGWHRIAARFGSQTAKERLCALLQRVASEVEPEKVEWVAMGYLYEECDQERAIASYMKALELDIAAPVAANNLAMLLVRSSQAEKRAKALGFAQQAVAAKPGEAEFLDTLAEVQEALGDLPAARKSLEAARDAQPRNPRWLVRLAEVCYALATEEGESAGRSAIRRLDGLLNDGISISEELRERAGALRLR